MSNLNDFFNPTVKPQNPMDNSSNSAEFRPSHKKGQNGVYEAVIRFLPNPSDPANKSMIQKFTAYIMDPRNGQKRAIDDPRSIGQQSIIGNTFFALRNSGNSILAENSKQFSSKLSIYSLVQVLSCKSEPQLEGKILVWRYGQKVLEKINAEINPPMGEGHNPFNLLLGRPFSLKVKEVSGFPNYDACAFFDLPINQGGMRIQYPDATGALQWMVVTNETVATKEGQQGVFDYLTKNAPDMQAYEYRPWSAEDTQFVNEMVQLYSNPTTTVAAVQQQMGVAQPQNPAAGMFTGMPSMGQVPQQAAPQAPAFGTPSFPGASAAPAFSQPATPSFGQPAAAPAPAAPTFGTPAGDPRGFNNAAMPSGIGEMIGMPSTPAAPQPVAGLNLSDVLAGTMVEG